MQKFLYFTMNPLLQSLAQGDRRTTHGVDEVVALCLKNPGNLVQLADAFALPANTVRMRALDALEKISQQRAELLLPLASQILQLHAQVGMVKEDLWNLTQILPRLRLPWNQVQKLLPRLQTQLAHPSRIAAAAALQALVEFSFCFPQLQPAVLAMVLQSAKSDAPSLRARAKHLLKLLEKKQPFPSKSD